MAQIGLDVIYGLFLEQLAESPPCIKPLTRGHGHVDGGSDPGHLVHILRRDRLLEEEGYTTRRPA